MGKIIGLIITVISLFHSTVRASDYNWETFVYPNVEIRDSLIGLRDADKLDGVLSAFVYIDSVEKLVPKEIVRDKLYMLGIKCINDSTYGFDFNYRGKLNQLLKPQEITNQFPYHFLKKLFELSSGEQGMLDAVRAFLNFGVNVEVECLLNTSGEGIWLTMSHNGEIINNEPSSPVNKTDKSDLLDEDIRLLVVNEPAHFHSEEFNLNSWINAKIDWTSLNCTNIKGHIVVQWTVDYDGNSSDFKILKGINDEIDQAVLLILPQLPKMVPALSGRSFVSSRYRDRIYISCQIK